MGRWAGLLVGTVLAMGDRPANATPSARLVYSRAHGAESCPAEEALRRAVAVRVGYDPFFAWAQKTIVAAMAPASPRGFVAHVNLVDEQGMDHGARALRTQGACSELLDAAALAIAIAIDPRSLVADSEAPPAPASAPPPAAPEGTAASSPPEDRPQPQEPSIARVEPSSAFAVEGSAGAVASMGVGPQPVAAGLALGPAVRWRRVSLAVEGLVNAPASELTSGGSVVSWLGAVAVIPCAHAGPVFACAVGQVGSLQAWGEGVTPSGTHSALWLAAGGRVGAHVRLGGEVFLRLRGDLLADFYRPTLQLNDQPWMAPPMAGMLGTDVVVRFR